jgi:ABC-type phosphate/phosphonate transport system substrate-binding protein
VALDRERVARDFIFRTLGVREFWTNPDIGPIISSEVLAWAAGNHRGEAIAGNEQRYRIGMLLEESDTEKSITSYYSLFNYLERFLSDGQSAVRLDVRVYREKKSAISALANHEIHFLKIGAMSYLAATDSDPGIKPLVAQRPEKRGAIFMLKGSGIQSVPDLVGKTIAIGDRMSTVAMSGLLRLKQAGVPTKNLRAADRRNHQATGTKDGVEKLVNEWPIRAVESHQADAGIISESVLKRINNPDLVVLDRFSSFPIMWLVGSGVSKEAVVRIKEAMVNLGDKSVFEKLSDNVKSYVPVSEEDIKSIRAAAGLTEAEGGEADAIGD